MLMTFGVFFVSLLGRAHTAFYSKTIGWERWLCAGIASALFGIAAMGFVDTVFYRPQGGDAGRLDLGRVVEIAPVEHGARRQLHGHARVIGPAVGRPHFGDEHERIGALRARPRAHRARAMRASRSPSSARAFGIAAGSCGHWRAPAASSRSISASRLGASRMSSVSRLEARPHRPACAPRAWRRNGQPPVRGTATSAHLVHRRHRGQRPQRGALAYMLQRAARVLHEAGAAIAHFRPAGRPDRCAHRRRSRGAHASRCRRPPAPARAPSRS